MGGAQTAVALCTVQRFHGPCQYILPVPSNLSVNDEHRTGRVLKFETVETNNFREENDNLQKQLSLQENQVSMADAAEPRDIIKSSVTAIPAVRCAQA